MSQSEKTKGKLIRSAKKIFSEKGFWDTKVSDIVKDAGVAQGTFYLYFKSKDEIFKELVLEIRNHIIEIIDKYKNADENIIKTLIDLKSEILEYLYQNKEIARIFLFQLFTKEELMQIYFETLNYIEDFDKNLIQKGVAKGVIKYPDVENIINIILGYGRRLFETEVLLKGKPLDEVKKIQKEGIQIIFKGIS